jgi:hypothetical protein
MRQGEPLPGINIFRELVYAAEDSARPARRRDGELRRRTFCDNPSAAESPRAEKEKLDKKIAEAIRGLGDSSSKARERARRALLEIGTPAEEALRLAAGSANERLAARADTICGEVK